jgi:tRNA/tmRNA/rRNA uracil-C5-methylase (TrmA/RlmC/RlmD family)
VVLQLRIEKVVHGGLFLARDEGKVILVSGALPGELVEAAVVEEKKSFSLANVVKVLEPSQQRVVSVGQVLGRAAGSIDYGHANLDYQRQLKGEVLKEALARTSRIDWDVEIRPADQSGLAYRTRIQLHADDKGRLGVRVPRSHDHVRIQSHPLAVEAINSSAALTERYEPGSRVSIACDSDSQVLTDSENGLLTQRAGERKFRITPKVFWQAHYAAPQLLVTHVLESLGEVGSEVLDLYAGAGLFAANIAQAHPTGQVLAVESSKDATGSGFSSGADLANLRFETSDVLRYLRARTQEIGVVVVDPPRSGASGKVIAELIRLGARRVIYVACDPVALARDLGTLVAAGYKIEEMTGFDIFPQTHHFETVATLSK